MDCVVFKTYCIVPSFVYIEAFDKAIRFLFIED